jgi:hypothetical protein
MVYLQCAADQLKETVVAGSYFVFTKSRLNDASALVGELNGSKSDGGIGLLANVDHFPLVRNAPTAKASAPPVNVVKLWSNANNAMASPVKHPLTVMCFRQRNAATLNASSKNVTV